MGNLGKTSVILVLLCMAFFIVEPITVKSCVYKTFRNFIRIKVMWQTCGWEEIQGSHFIVRYRPQDNNIAEMVLATAEESYQPVSRQFGYSFRDKIPIVIYPTKESLGRSFGWAADESAMGVYWAGVIRILSPNIWVEEENLEGIRTAFENEGPIVHELTHYMVDYSAGGNYTRWFTEGIAQYEEEKLTGYRIENREIRHPDELYPLNLMDREFDSLGDQPLAYFESFQAVKYLVDRYGEKSLQEILTCLGRGRTIEESFQKTLGISVDQFETDFQTYMIVNE